MEIGKIFKADEEKFPDAKHLIVYLGNSETRAGYYKGLMLTHDKRKENIPMEKEHFSDDFNFNGTHVVGIGLLKPQEWELHEHKGNLSEKGLEFVYANVKNINEPENTWNELVPTSI